MLAWVGVLWISQCAESVFLSWAEQATWESIGILVSTLSWSYFLGLELHPYAGAQISLGLVCCKPWVLSAGAGQESLCSNSPPVHLPPALFPGGWSTGEHLSPFSWITSLCSLHRKGTLRSNFFSFSPGFNLNAQTQKLLWCSLRELNYPSLFTPQLTWNFLA